MFELTMTEETLVMTTGDSAFVIKEPTEEEKRNALELEELLDEWKH